MTLFAVALTSLRGQLMASLFTACSVALGVAFVRSTVLLSVFNLLGLVEAVWQMLLTMVALVVLRFLCVALYRATRQRRREIATMRALGARRLTMLLIILLASWTITLVGGIVGLGGGDGLARLGARIIAAGGGLVRHPPGWTPLQPLLLTGAVGLGTLAGLIPAMLAYRTEVADHLAPRS